MTGQHDTHVVVWRLWRQWRVSFVFNPPPQPDGAEVVAAFRRGRCPDCDGFIFRPGPRGGLAQNVECVGCGGRFNVAHWNGPFNPWPEPGIIISAERIGNDGEWREDMFPKVLQ